MKLATREQILAASDLTCEMVPTPEWGAETNVCVRTLTAIERDRWDVETYGGQKKVDLIGYKARFCTLAIVGEDNKPLFSPEDAEQLAGKSAAVVERVFTVAARLNGLMKANVEEIEKNSAAAPSVESSGN